MNLFELGQALKEARIQQRLTQSELANCTGVSLSSISGLERGSLPEIGTVKLLQLFAAVELELQPRPAGQRRTLDDVNAENVRTSYAAQTVLDAVKVPMSTSNASDKALGGTTQAPGLRKPVDNTKKNSLARQRVRHVQKKVK
jgi:transcriptional regulator with XRE-family HTH domain